MCSFVNVESAVANAVLASRYYWLAASAMLVAILATCYWQRRWSFSALIGFLLVIFHPSWTIPPLYLTSCAFINLQASQVVLVAMIVLAAYELYRGLRRSRHGPLAKRIVRE